MKRYFPIALILVAVALSAIAIAADTYSEAAAQKRLRELLPKGSEEKYTQYGGMLTMVPIPEASRYNVRQEQYDIFKSLELLGTRNAIRVLAEYLWDTRHIYEPGRDYGSPTLGEDAMNALFEIRRAGKLPNAPATLEKADWRKWWIDNRLGYYQNPSPNPHIVNDRNA